MLAGLSGRPIGISPTTHGEMILAVITTIMQGGLMMHIY